MQVNVIVGASHAYACIKDDEFLMDVQLSAGRSPATSLRESAKECRDKAAAYLKRAERMEHAADKLVAHPE